MSASGQLDSAPGPPPPANRRAFGTASTSTTASFTSQASASTSTSASASAPSSNRLNSSTSTARSALRSSTNSHLAPPLLGTSPGSSTSTASATTSVTASPTPGQGRARSQSSASGGAAQFAAERAGQWLAALAPRGEGRTREFITSSLSGVATVASTVGQEVNGFIKAGNARPGSFVGSPPEARARANSRASRRDSFAAVLNSPPSPIPNNPNGPGPGQTPGSGSQPSRAIARPANASRLGHNLSLSHSSLVAPSPVTSPTQNAFVRSNTLPQLPHTAPSTPRGPPSPVGLGHTRSASHTSTHSLSALATRVRGAGMPYKVGFQPSGVRSDRTAQFMAERSAQSADRDKEEGRLGRRWAKLVDLHFNPATQTRPVVSTPPTSRKSSGLLNMDLDALNPKEVWKGLKMAAGPNPEEARKRAAEQTIVKWEEDADVRKCRICGVTFTLATRKHHCRLCGRIVCSLPPTPPALLAVQMNVFGAADPSADVDGQGGLPAGTRREKCSLLLVADYRTGRGQEVDEGFVGWMSLDSNASSDPDGFRSKRGEVARRSPTHTRRSSASSLASTTPLPQQPQEVQVKGVRVCRDCWGVVSRKQVMADRARVTPFQRLYVALRTLQSEIDGVLPDFTAELSAAKAKLANEDPEDIDLHDLVDAHKHLLALLGRYDAIAKRISAVPCAEGGSQATVQSVLARSAATFLARAMVQVHEVPRLERAVAAAKAQHMVVVQTGLPDVLRAEGVGDAEEVARALQPLLEQQAQLESFIAEANAQRKYDDSRSLAAALAEIESEIARLTASALS